eukprot:TRINITY_DN9061_c1_g1_i3.p1 TRINITY_DN9061_c1_g1~~TRINITY_DN9061_c1_g1_i3.p1  ORF type:complete len:437 (+),score=39.31 TRINITY_DN9061_c1_g1_i3:362-1672(+)
MSFLLMLWLWPLLHVDGFDVIVPVGPLDGEVWKENAGYLRRNVEGCGEVHVIEGKEMENKILGWAGIEPGIAANGWVRQQLVKLYAPLYYEGLGRGSVYLVVDADVRWVQRAVLMEESNRSVLFLTTGGGMDKLVYNKFIGYALPQLADGAQTFTTGVAHHIVVATPVLRELMSDVSAQHGGKPFHEVFTQSPVRQSEYHLYYSYAVAKHGQRANTSWPHQVRSLPFAVVPDCNQNPSPGTFTYLTCHHHFRECGARSHWGVECYNAGATPCSWQEGDFYPHELLSRAVKIRVTNLLHVGSALWPSLPCTHKAVYGLIWLLAVCEPLLYLYLLLKHSPHPLHTPVAIVVLAATYHTLYPLQPPFYIYASLGTLTLTIKSSIKHIKHTPLPLFTSLGIWLGLIKPLGLYESPCAMWVGFAALLSAVPVKRDKAQRGL